MSNINDAELEEDRALLAARSYSSPGMVPAANATGKSRWFQDARRGSAG